MRFECIAAQGVCLKTCMEHNAPANTRQGGVEMRLCKRALVTVFLASAAFTALGAQAMAAPMPWETSKVPSAVVHTASATVHDRGTVTTLCAAGCYQ
jgi:hypothetical protein